MVGNDFTLTISAPARDEMAARLLTIVTIYGARRRQQRCGTLANYLLQYSRRARSSSPMEQTQSPHVDVLSFPGNIGRLACRPENRSSPMNWNYLTSIVALAFAFGAAAVAQQAAWSDQLGSRLALPVRSAKGHVRRAAGIQRAQREGRWSRHGITEFRDQIRASRRRQFISNSGNS
jgi:hypothetical protein